MRISFFHMILCYGFLSTGLVKAQGHKLVLQGSARDSFVQLSGIRFEYSSFVDCQTALRDAHMKLVGLGFLSAGIDSLQQTDSVSTARVWLGKRYLWASLKNKNIPAGILAQSRFDEKKYFNQKIDISQIAPVFEKVIRYFEDNGFPFASISFDSIRVRDEMVYALLNLDKGPLIKMDTIILNEEANISRHYMMQYLGLKQGAPYNESKMKNISTRIRELNFLQESYPWRMDFSTTSNKLNLYLKNKSANKADVLIGMMPNNAETGGRFLLTGDVKLAFVNALAQGESLQLNWQNLQFKSPRYNILFSVPYLLNTSLGVSGKFDFYKKDTTFRTINGELGLFYQINANDRIKIYYELASSRLGSVNIPGLLASRRLPANADVTYRTFGIESITQKLDYKLNPRKGYRITLNASLSFRNILKNSTIENTFDPVEGKPFAYLYDTMQLKNNKYNFFTEIQYFVPLSKRLVLASMYHGGITYSNKALYRNELFQIGGYRLLRGFDEGSIFSDHYHLLTVEPRYLFSLNSYFFIFSDFGYMQSKYADSFIKDTPYSFGVGMSFETRAGLFNISYGVGKSKTQAMELKNSKVHFGYVSVF